MFKVFDGFKMYRKVSDEFADLFFGEVRLVGDDFVFHCDDGTFVCGEMQHFVYSSSEWTTKSSPTLRQIARQVVFLL